MASTLGKEHWLISRSLGTSSNHQDSLPRYLTLSESPKKTISFTREEMDRRLVNLRNYMASSNLDACVLTSHHNILYFSDFMAHDWGRPSGLYVTHDDAILITPCKSTNAIHSGNT